MKYLNCKFCGIAIPVIGELAEIIPLKGNPEGIFCYRCADHYEEKEDETCFEFY